MSLGTRVPVQADVDSGRFRFLISYLDKTINLPRLLVEDFANMTEAQTDIAALELAVASLQKRLAEPVADVTALKAIDTTDADEYPDKIGIIVEDIDKLLILDRDSSAPEDLGPPVQIVAPTAGVGRWYVSAATVGTNDLEDACVTVAKVATAVLQAANHTIADAAGRFPLKGASAKTVEAALQDLGLYQGMILGFVDLDGSPPGSPSVGDRYVATATAGVFTAGYLYVYNGSTWDEIVPENGMLAYYAVANALVAWDGAAWVGSMGNRGLPFLLVSGFAELDGTPPGAPSHGDVYIATATAGAFTVNHPYMYDSTDTSWKDLVLGPAPLNGSLAYLAPDGDFYQYDTLSAAWINITNRDQRMPHVITSFYDFGSGAPGAPTAGQSYVSSTTGGGYTADYIYTYDGTDWRETAPGMGDKVFDRSAGILWEYLSAWAPVFYPNGGSRNFLGSIVNVHDFASGAPGAPSIGDLYISSSTGGGFTANNVYIYFGNAVGVSGWFEIVAVAGLVGWNAADEILGYFDGTAWDVVDTEKSDFVYSDANNRTGGTLSAGTLVAIDGHVDSGAVAGQLASWALEGSSSTNTDDGVLYGTLADAAGTRTVSLFSDSGRTVKVAEGSKVGDGLVSLAAVGASGLTGEVTVTYTGDGNFEVTTPIDDVPSVRAFDGSGSDTIENLFGVVTDDISDGDSGEIQREGEYFEVLVVDSTTIAAGDLLYYSAAVAGRVTNSDPGHGEVVGIATHSIVGGVDRKVRAIRVW